MNEHRFTALIIDDLPTNVFLLEEILARKGGYRVISSNSGPHGRELAQRERPDIILLDIMMPGEDGFETCRKLQQDPRTVDIPIIFISALTDVDSRVKGLSIGGWDFISKPFHAAEILARVRNYLRLRQAYLQIITEQTKRLQQVKNAQKAILVRPGELPAAGFAVHYTPVHEAGGDFYDVFALGKDLFGYFVADISGHDLGASFATSALKALIRQNSSALHGVEETMRIINTILLSLFSGGQHLTAIYAVLDKRTMSLSIVSAGHPPMLFLPQNGAPQWVEAEGDVMGAFEDAIFVKQEIRVAFGDRFFLLTDGLIESFTDQGRSRTAGLEEFKEIALRTCEEALQTATAAIVKGLFASGREPEDDVLLLGVDIAPPEAKAEEVSPRAEETPMITKREDGKGFDALLAARFSEIDAVCEAAQFFLDCQDLQPISFAMILGIREALTNAIQHGSGRDPRKRVRFSLVREGAELILTTADQGPGFDWQEAARACAVDLAESGRGICILYHYFDKVEFNDTGNELRLVKVLNAKQVAVPPAG